MTVLTDQKIYFGGYDLTTHANALSLEYGAEAVDDTRLGDSTRQFTGGLKTVRFQVEGFYDPEDFDAPTHSAIGVQNNVLTFSSTGTQNDVAYSTRVLGGDMTTGGSIGDNHTYSFGGVSNEDLVRGRLLLNQDALTTTGATTGYQLGAVSASQYVYGFLHVMSVYDASDVLAVTVESDATNSFSGSETTRLTFSNASAITAQRVRLNGAITDTWWRVVYTITDNSGNASFKAALNLGIL